MTFISSAKVLHKTLPTDGDWRALLWPGLHVRARAMLTEQQAGPGRKREHCPSGQQSQSLLRAGTHWAPCGVWNTASLHRVPSTRSSLLWSHSGAVMGEDWAHPMRILLQSPAEQQSPEVRKWRCITWWEWREAPEAFRNVDKLGKKTGVEL